jgi:hypothetical protein
VNINNKLNNISEIKSFLKELNKADWKCDDISPDKIQNFLSRHLGIIANQKELRSDLMLLGNRVFTEFKNSPEACHLSLAILGITRESKMLPKLPDDVWGKILSSIPLRDPNILLEKRGIASGLENFYPSKGKHELAKITEGQWASEQLVSLKKYGCKTAKDAIDYVMHNKLTGANLWEFKDLDESNLKYLFENCPKLENLFISSEKIKSFSEKTPNLKTLIIYCSNLQSLPELPQLQKLDCSTCYKLQSLPEFPQLQGLNCSGCNLQSLPELPQLQELYCPGCDNLQSLPKLPQLQVLKCSGCDSLQSLPELPQLQVLNCSGCNNLQSLVELPQLRVFNCSGCHILQSLPALPQVKKLNCSGSDNLQRLPALPQVQELNCSWCTNLQSLPALPKAKKLDYTGCQNLQNS